MALVLTGRVVTLDPAREIVEEGAVYLAEGLIQSVAAAGDPAPPGFETAPRVRTRGVIYPGLIDLHNHLAYNHRGLWFPPRAEPYMSRDQWPRAATYQAEISRPAAALGTAAGKALLKFAEVKAIVGGVTAVQGSPGLSRPYEGWLVRNVEHESFGTGEDRVLQSVLTLDLARLGTYRAHVERGHAFIYHLAEGTNPKLLREYRDVRQARVLGPRLIGIHCTALGTREFGAWGRKGGTVVWSPFSNLWLYRATTDVAAARDAGLRVCLGADWGPSGSKNLLGELKVADLWNRTRLDRAFGDRDLCAMVTSNPGDALATAWGERIGRLKEGLCADLLVVSDRRRDPWRNLIEATERDVRLVCVGGRPVYGSAVLMRGAGAVSPEPITVAGIRRAISLVDPAIPEADLGWAQVVATLESARRDPARAFEIALASAPRGEEPLRVIPDMPGGEMAGEIRAPADLGPVVIPPLDTLAHDMAFLRALGRDRAPILDGLLDGLRDFYR